LPAENSRVNVLEEDPDAKISREEGRAEGGKRDEEINQSRQSCGCRAR
jgi:hypothetical protein